MKMRVIFKSGAEVTLSTEKFKITRNRYTGELQELEWSWDGGPSEVMKYVNLSEIACIIRLDEPDDEDGLVDDQRSTDVVDGKWTGSEYAATASTPAGSAGVVKTAVAEVNGG